MDKSVFRKKFHGREEMTYWQDSIIKNLQRTLGFLKTSKILSFVSSLFSSMKSLLSSFNSRDSKVFWSKLLPLTFAIHSRTSIASSRRPCRKSHLTSFQNMNHLVLAPTGSDAWIPGRDILINNFYTVISRTVTDIPFVQKASWPWRFWYKEIISTKANQHWWESHSSSESPVTKNLSLVS